MSGRKIKRKYARTETLKIRISREYKLRLKNLVLYHKRNHSIIISQSDIVEWALNDYSIKEGFTSL